MHALGNDTKKKIGVYFSKWKYSQLECFGHFRNIFSKYIKNLMVSFNSSWKTKQFDTQHVWLNFNRSWIELVSSNFFANQTKISGKQWKKWQIFSSKSHLLQTKMATMIAAPNWYGWFITNALESHQFAAVEFTLNLFLQF